MKVHFMIKRVFKGRQPFRISKSRNRTKRPPIKLNVEMYLSIIGLNAYMATQFQ